MADFIKSDLEFILEQIKLSEYHTANGGTLSALVGNAVDANGVPLQISSPGLPLGLRTVSGIFNNVSTASRINWGAADQDFLELVPHQFRPGYAPNAPDPDNGGPLGPGSVIDATPREISNLVVDQTINNPAAIEAALEYYEVPDAAADTIRGLSDALQQAKIAGTGEQAAFDALHAEMEPHVVFAVNTNAIGVPVEGVLVLPNVAPDEGLSAPFNSWMTFFGQFFDHGLDLIGKETNGSIVFIPLSPDDPRYVPGGNTNFMVLSRSDKDAQFNSQNATSPFVDQNQTYTSHPSHQVFLREYEMVGGRPVPTGDLIKGANGGMATWADVKAQAATMLGIQLTDADALRVPSSLTDHYGNFIAGSNGFPQLMTRGAPIQGNPAANGGQGVLASNAVWSGHAFLLDIAHNANPFSSQGAALPPDGDTTVDSIGAPRPAGTYDDELLDRHFIAGDGRVNENVALTAVHHVFHSEHNRLVHFSQDVLIRAFADGEGDAASDLAFLNEWLRTDLGSVPANLAALGPNASQAAVDAVINGLDWDGARLFQAAKFGTEMQYQHLVFEEFGRKIQPNIDIFIAPTGYDQTVNPAIFAEFAHAVYRLGHSMLPETVVRYDPDFNGFATEAEESLVDLFLNPVSFDDRDGNGAGPRVSAEAAAGAVVRGMSRQAGQQIDEFVTDALRSNLLGLPLDLATINIARGRDTGLPTLNEARVKFFGLTGDSQLTPYTSWFDFALHLKNQFSIVNFIAAYGTHNSITGTIAERRDAAFKLVFGDASLDETDRLNFLHSEEATTAANTGLNDVDLWIGGWPSRSCRSAACWAPRSTSSSSSSSRTAERRPILLPGAHRWHELHHRARAELVRQHDHEAHGRAAPAARRVLDADLYPRGRSA